MTARAKGITIFVLGYIIYSFQMCSLFSPQVGIECTQCNQCHNVINVIQTQIKITGDSSGKKKQRCLHRGRLLVGYELIAYNKKADHNEINNWFMLSVRTSSYGCTWEVWRAREKRKSCSRRSREQL